MAAVGLLLASTSMQLAMLMLYVVDVAMLLCVFVVQEPSNLAYVGIRVAIGGDGACECFIACAHLLHCICNRADCPTFLCA